MAKNTPTLNFPPLPTMTWNGSAWSFPMFLPICKGHTVKHYSKTKKTDGIIRVVVPLNDQVPSTEQIAAVQYMQKSQERIMNSVLKGCLKAYHSVRDFYGQEAIDEYDKMPAIKNPSDVLKYAFLETIRIHPESKSKCSYTGFEFHSDFELDHGFGVCLHRATVQSYGIGQYACPPHGTA